MKRHYRPCLLVVMIWTIVGFAAPALACSWAEGYFYQVTNLRGTLVGVNRGDPRQMAKWMRQRVTQGNADLTLYIYQADARLEDRKVVKKAKANANGYFDFGPLPRGHYTLEIKTPWEWHDVYDVEVIESRNKTASVTIDISPIFPDCTGGHEFIVHQK